MLAPRAPTTPAALNAAGRGVAAIDGCPPLARAASAGLLTACCTCCRCIGVGATCESCAATRSCAVGMAVTPPDPPL